MARREWRDLSDVTEQRIDALLQSQNLLLRHILRPLEERIEELERENAELKRIAATKEH